MGQNFTQPIMSIDTNRLDSTSLDSRCPLCLGRKLRRLQSISAEAIVGIYGPPLSAVVRSELGDADAIGFVVCQSCDLRFFSPVLAASENLYEELQKLDSYYQSEKPEFDFARSQIESRDAVLEVGCGAGAFGASIKCDSYVGLELTPSSAARARALGLHIREETVERHSVLKPAAYDIVCAFQVLEHIAEPHSFIAGCLAALRPGGRLILSIPSADSFAGDLPNHALDLPPHHMTRWSDRCLASLNSIFPVSMEKTWHEPLRPIHYRMYVQSRFYRAYCRLIRSELLPVDISSVGRLALSLCWKLSKVLRWGWSMSEQRGISVTVVLRKPA
jgi:SAM-dependent methyltransferase